MQLKHGYQRVAKRSLLACEGIINGSIKPVIHEKAAFLAYHAFELTGCALTKHSNLFIVNSHAKKLVHFKLAVDASGNTQLITEYGVLATILTSLRDKLLYPRFDSSDMVTEMPENQLALSDVQDLRDKVASVINLIDTII